MFDLREVKKMIQMVEGANISHLSVESDGVKVEIKKEFYGAVPQHSQVVIPMDAASSSVAAGGVSADSSKKTPEVDPNLVAITSQMVGTFYASPNPDSPPYAKVGDTIQKGQVVCIIEAMKLFNEIESELSGTVEKVCVENGKPVEYGQELFLIRLS